MLRPTRLPGTTKLPLNRCFRKHYCDAHSPSCNSYRKLTLAVAIDDFFILWTGLKFYVFSPFSVITSLLKKIREDKAEGVRVLPGWLRQPWFPKGIQMATRPPVKLKACKMLLSLSNQPERTEPLHSKLDILICHLSA